MKPEPAKKATSKYTPELVAMIYAAATPENPLTVERCAELAAQPEFVKADIDVRLQLARNEATEALRGVLGRMGGDVFLTTSKIRDQLLELRERLKNPYESYAESPLPSTDVSADEQTDHRNTPQPQAGSSPAGESYAEPPVLAENGSNFGRNAVGSVRVRDRGAHTRPAAANGAARGGGTSTSAPADGQVNGTQRKILESIAGWHMAGIIPSRAMVALLAGIDPNGGHFSNSIGPLNSRGLISQTTAGVELTGKGSAIVKDVPVPTRSQYHEQILAIVKKKSGTSARLLAYIMNRGNHWITADALGRSAGVDPSGGHFSNSVGPLSTLGLIERHSGRITPTSLLFPEGLR